MLLSQLLGPVALKNGSKPAFRYLKHTISYKEYWETANRFSYYIQKEIGHQKRIGLWMSNCPHVAYAFIALANTKSCTVPLNPWGSPNELIHKIKDSGLTHILCSGDHIKNIREFLHNNSLGQIPVIDIEAKRAGEYDPSYTPPSQHPIVENDEILLLYTPGTTGKYKGCLFNHKSVTGALTNLKNAYKVLPTDMFYTQLHYNSAFALMHYLLMPLSAGAAVFISDEVDPRNVIVNCNEFRVTRMAPNPSAVSEIVRVSVEEKLPLNTVKYFYFTGTPLKKEVWSEVIKHTKVQAMNCYGMTEYLGTIAVNTPDKPGDISKPWYCGPGLPGTKIRVVDDENDEIDKKKPQVGQLLAMGPNVMMKYLGLAEEQKMTVRGTWLFTGDIVSLDPEGGITFQDRKADIVVTDIGKKVSARDVEPLVRNIAFVEECAYIQAFDAKKKPMPILVVVKKVGSALSSEQIIEFLKQKMTKDKVPVQVLFVDSVPRTPSGAVNRSKLRMLYGGI